MRPLKTRIVVSALGIVLAAGSVLAQTPPPQKPPSQQPTQPPAQPPPQKPTQPPVTPPVTQQPQQQPPRPFPEGAKIAYVHLQAVVQNSTEGKAGSAKLKEFQKKATDDIAEKRKALEGMQTKLQQGGSVMSDQARGELEKSIDKANRELQFMQQNAQAEGEQMQNELQQEFLRRLSPVLKQIAEEKGLHMILEIQNTAAIYVDTGLDLSDEVTKRFDAASKTAPKK
jgi:Skp family chaperone for outer membrane proteins